MSAYVNAGGCSLAMARDALAARVTSSSPSLWASAIGAPLVSTRAATPSRPSRCRVGARHAAARGGRRRRRGVARSPTSRAATGKPPLGRLPAGLVLAGELHNNLRMAWKAIPAWHAALLGGAGGTAEARCGRWICSSAQRPLRARRRRAALVRRPALVPWLARPAGPRWLPTSRPTSVMASKIKAGDLERRARQQSAARCFDVAPTPPTARALEGGVPGRSGRASGGRPEAVASSGQASASPRRADVALSKPAVGGGAAAGSEESTGVKLHFIIPRREAARYAHSATRASVVVQIRIVGIAAVASQTAPARRRRAPCR